MGISDEYKALWPRFYKFDNSETEHDPYLTYVDDEGNQFSFEGWVSFPEDRPVPLMKQTYDGWSHDNSFGGLHFLPDLLNEWEVKPVEA